MSEGKLQDRVAVVTGAGQGIGEGVARLYAAEGAQVAVVDINDFGGNILGSTLDMAGERRLVSILADNPLGQGHQSTPLGVVRLVVGTQARVLPWRGEGCAERRAGGGHGCRW